MNEETPVFIKLKETIKEEIEQGKLSPGCMLPSERAMAAEHGISRMTVRHAISLLVAEGALYREQGRGTFVSARKMQQRNMSSFSETVKQKGFTPGTQVLEFSLEKPPSEIVRKLMAGEGDTYRALRLRLADDTPVAVEEVFIPAHICPGLRKSELTSSLYGVMNGEYGHKVGSADCSVSASHPSAKQQAYLAISRNTPVLKIESLYYSVSGVVLYYERAVYRADMYEYNIRITTQGS